MRAPSRWMTLDRLLSVEPGTRASGLRNVPNTLAIFDTHFPRFPVLPGVLILGSLATLADELLGSDGGPRWRLACAEKVAYRHFVAPGDQMVLTVELKERSDSEAILSGEAKVDAKVVTRARRMRFVPVED